MQYNYLANEAKFSTNLIFFSFSNNVFFFQFLYRNVKIRLSIYTGKTYLFKVTPYIYPFLKYCLFNISAKTSELIASYKDNVLKTKSKKAACHAKLAA